MAFFFWRTTIGWVRGRLAPLAVRPFNRLLTSYTLNELGDAVGIVALAVLTFESSPTTERAGRVEPTQAEGAVRMVPVEGEAARYWTRWRGPSGQGIVAGIGFLGAGAIVKGKPGEEIHGLTTAASIWVTAAIGIAVGMGRETTAILCAILAFVILSLLRRIERHIGVERDEPENDPRGENKRIARGR